MTDQPIVRVHYYDQQFLRTQDFQDEQSYLLGLHRRHNLSAHIWGIVAGLTIDKDKEKSLAVQPGLAVDGYGRQLVLAYPQKLSPDAFDDLGSDTLDVWLIYTQQSSDPAPDGYACRSKKAEAGEPYRVQESGQVSLRKYDPNKAVIMDLPLRRQPEGVPDEDLVFNPTRTPPDDPSRSWPVFLGQIRRVRNNGQNDYEVSSSGRPYVGLVGEMIRSPSGKAWLQLGPEEEGDDVRFGVFLEDPGAVTRPSPRFSINEQGNLAVCGDARLYGNLTIDGGTAEFRLSPEGNAIHPWSIYHTTGDPTTIAPNEQDTQAILPVSRSSVDQLRISMARAAVGKAPNEIVFGVFSAKTQQFEPCLTIADDCTVTVHGNLVLKNEILHNTGGPELDARAKEIDDSAFFGAAMAEATRSSPSVSRVGLMPVSERIESFAPQEAIEMAVPAVPEAQPISPSPDDQAHKLAQDLRENDAVAVALAKLLQQEGQKALRERLLSMLSSGVEDGKADPGEADRIGTPGKEGKGGDKPVLKPRKPRNRRGG
jgi:hypothetical protein